MKYPAELPTGHCQSLIESCTFNVVDLFGVDHMCCALKLYSGFIVTSELVTGINPEEYNEELLKKLTWLNALNRLTNHEYYRQFAELNGTTAESN